MKYLILIGEQMTSNTRIEVRPVLDMSGTEFYLRGP